METTKTPKNTQLYLSTKEVAERYSISIGTLEVWRQQTKNGSPRGPQWSVLEGSVRYHILDLEKWELEQNPVQASK